MKKSTIYGILSPGIWGLLCFIMSYQLWAQSPGGVSLTQELWLKADQVHSEGLPNDGQAITLWYDWSGKNRNHIQNGTNAVPTFLMSGDLMNFQPALNFDSGTNTKLIGPDFNVQANRSYYIFYVSRLKEGTTGTAVLYSLNAARNNNNGWLGGNPYFTTLGTATAYRHVNTNNNGKNYGINAVIRPNGTLLSQMSYYNFIPQSFTARAMTITSGQSVIGNSNTAVADPFYGDVQEIIVFSGPQNTYMTDEELQKVYSYLSIKYGISLESAASAPKPDYLNSNGDIIWNGSQDTAYQNYVFGIGRDDNGGLYQKQSVNYDKPVVTVFMGNALSTLNSSNTGTLIDNTFMMLGSNDLEGLVKYEYSAGQVFANGSLTENINFKHNIILKARTFNQSAFTVNMKTHIDTKYILVCPDENFAPSNTRIYKVENDIATNVNVNDGEYISFALSGAKPGGVELLTELWLKADNVLASTVDSTAITSWKDASVFGRDHTKSGTIATPVIRNKNGLMNYHTHLQFNAFSALTAPSYLDSNKSYYLFYVSEVSNTSAASILYAFNSNGNVNNNNQGWYIGNPTFTVGGYGTANFRTHTNPQGKTYGIVAVERPNNAGVEQRITFNGTTQSFAGSTLTGTGTGESLIGSRRVGNYLPFLGNLQEIIVLSGEQGAQMNSLDLQKVNSYLAVKYGITLDTASQPDYLDSYGNIVWKGSDNTGYQNHIFGIGRDDNTGLYQKQSISYDRSIMTVFVGNEIRDLNSNNSGTLNNGEFLMFGSNAEENVLTEYDYKVGTQFANKLLSEEVNYRNKIILKAQASVKNTFNVNIQADLGAKFILVSSDETFAPANTRVYEVSNKIAEEVEINNGDYIGFAVYANAPGGVVNGLRLWLRADDLSSLEFDGDTENILTWKDQTSNENNYSYSLVNNGYKVPPVYRGCDSRMNFFPSIYFAADASLAINKGPMSVDKPDNSTSFVVYNSIGFTSNARTYTHGFGGVIPINSTTRHPAVGFAPAGGQGRIAATTGLYNGTVKGFVLGATALHMVRLRTNTAPGGQLIQHDFGGLSDEVMPANNFGSDFGMASGGTIGSASVGSGQFDGLMSELFFYERELSEEEKVRIRTYLGMKYAITLYSVGSTDTNKIPFDYVLSNGTDVWNGTTAPYTKYHKNVTGLVRDDNSLLFVNKARSTDVDAVVTMQSGEVSSCGQGSTPALVNDWSGLFWGNDGATGTTVYDPNAKAVCGDLESRMNRIWLVNKTNLDKQKVIIRAGNSSSFVYNTQYKVYLLVADSAEDIANDNWSQAIPGEWIDGEVQFNYTFTNANTYFTFAGVQTPGSCTACAFQGYKTIDFSKVWTRADRGQKNKTIDLGDGFSANIAIDDPGNVLRSGYPRNSGKTLQMQRRGNRNTDTQPITTTISFTGGAAATSFEIYEIDRESRRLDDVEVYGICGGGIVKPKLTYVTKPNRSSYTIADSKANAKASGSASTSSYTNVRGRVFVDFPMAVEQVVIVHKVKYNSAAAGNQTIGIGPITLYCPKPLEINEDGLGLTLQAPESVLLCDEVPYTFRITNTNCDTKTVNLDDVLPDGMYWIKESLSIEELAGTPVSNEYANITQLNIQNIEVPGATTITVTAKARFEESAVAGSYSTRASIKYKNILDEEVTYESCDIMEGCGVTTVEALPSGRPKPVTVDEIKTDISCISEEGVVNVTVQVTNPNTTLDNVTLSVNISDDFTYVENSLISSFTLGGTIVSEEGSLIIEDFDLPTGTNTISFKIKAPVVFPEDFDSLELSLDMSTATTIECAYIDTSGIDMDIILPYCTYCTQDPNTEPATEMSKVGITSQKAREGEWLKYIPHGFIVLESKDKGFVVTRTTTANIPADKLVEGMIIYDTADNCIKLYNGTEWKCIERSCNE